MLQIFYVADKKKDKIRKFYFDCREIYLSFVQIVAIFDSNTNTIKRAKMLMEYTVIEFFATLGERKFMMSLIIARHMRDTNSFYVIILFIRMPIIYISCFILLVIFFVLVNFCLRQSKSPFD